VDIRTALFFAVALMAVSVGNGYGSGVTDSRDKQKYRTVKIGGQTWMAENLNYKTGNSWCYGDDESNCKKYGRLYDWNAAKSACPEGWHLPSREEWDRLMSAVGGVRKIDKTGQAYYEVVGKKLKSKTGWNDDYRGKSGNGADEFGFSALPGGCRYSNGSFSYVGEYGYWWSATEYGRSGHAFRWHMIYPLDYVSENTIDKSDGFSVRCLNTL
jgi:uncharacterized protein (TIGR02145 family)